MFADAYRLASAFTLPVIISSKLLDGTAHSGCAAFVVVNDEGWIVTAAHIYDTYFKYQCDAAEVKKYKEQLQSIEADTSLNRKAKDKKIRRIKVDKTMVEDHSLWWGKDEVSLNNVEILPEGDLAIGQLDPFDPKSFAHYPIFKDPTTLKPGTSLCKLGFPFHEIKSTYDTAKGFILAEGAVPLPLFPMEGIYSRNIIYGKSKDGKYILQYLETTTPGLMGQSGGPIFDAKGTVWAIQSRTAHNPLGFSPKIKRDGKDVEENQFLNVGLGIHPELINAFLTDNGIKFAISNY